MNILSRLAHWVNPQPNEEQWNINTEGLHVGKRIWCGRGWFVIARMEPGTVWVRQVSVEAQDVPEPLALTSDEVNALPHRIRLYIMELETRCDHSGDVRRLALQQDIIRELEASNRKFRDHSVMLNQVLWRMSEDLGEVAATDEERVADAKALIARFFAPKPPTASGSLSGEDRQEALGWAAWCERRGMGMLEKFLRRIAS